MEIQIIEGSDNGDLDNRGPIVFWSVKNLVSIFHVNSYYLVLMYLMIFVIAFILVNMYHCLYYHDGIIFTIVQP